MYLKKVDRFLIVWERGSISIGPFGMDLPGSRSSTISLAIGEKIE
jgi:hypothetical protein